MTLLYTVQPGDQLSALARRFGVSQERLRSDNGLAGDQPLVPGQALVVLRPTRVHQVKAGETLWGIARETGVPLRRLLQYNPTLAQGQALTSRFQRAPEATYHSLMAALAEETKKE